MAWAFLILLGGTLAAWGADTMSIKRDQEVLFYPAIAQRVPGQDAWRVELHGSVFEPEKRAVMLTALRRALKLDHVQLTADEQQIFNERARLFLVDHERRKQVIARLGLDTFTIGKSKADGEFNGAFVVSGLIVSNALAAVSPTNRWIHFDAALPWGHDRAFTGRALALEETGLSVISDIDDTIKVTDVRDGHQMLRNTFTRQFEAVPGMAAWYQRLAREQSAAFHYISASPWQLYEPLATFVHDHDFPTGTFTLKKFRWKNSTALSLFADPKKYKPTVVEPLLKQFPKRRFILIGDSGESDPEIYAALARKFPAQIERIYIRDVTNEPASAARYQKAFQGLPADAWQIFSRPEDLSR